MPIYSSSWTPPSPEKPRDYKGRARWYDGPGSGDPWLDKRIRCCACPDVDPRIHHIRSCGRWQCPLHGYYPRLAKARTLLRTVAPAAGRVYLSLVVHLNQPADGPLITRVNRIARTYLGRALARHGVEGELVAAPHHEEKGEGNRAAIHEHLHLNLSFVLASVRDPLALAADLETAAEETLAAVRRRGRTVDSKTARRIAEALADPRNTTTMGVNDYAEWMIDEVAIPRKIPRIDGRPRLVPLGERGVGPLIDRLVTVGRRLGMGDHFIQAKVEAAIRIYRECCAKAGLKVVGWRPWEYWVETPESAARATAYFEGFLPAGLPRTRHAPKAELGPGDHPGTYWKTWTGIEPWVFYTLRVRDQKDQGDPTGYPPIGQRHRLYYGPHKLGGQGQERRTPPSPQLPPETTPPAPHTPPTPTTPYQPEPTVPQPASAVPSTVDVPAAARSASVGPAAAVAVVLVRLLACVRLAASDSRPVVRSGVCGLRADRAAAVAGGLVPIELRRFSTPPAGRPRARGPPVGGDGSAANTS